MPRSARCRSQFQINHAIGHEILQDGICSVDDAFSSADEGVDVGGEEGEECLYGPGFGG